MDRPLRNKYTSWNSRRAAFPRIIRTPLVISRKLYTLSFRDHTVLYTDNKYKTIYYCKFDSIPFVSTMTKYRFSREINFIPGIKSFLFFYRRYEILSFLRTIVMYFENFPLSAFHLCSFWKISVRLRTIAPNVA